MRTFYLIGLLGLASGGPVSSAEIFHWTDSQGQSHFSDRAPTKAATPLALKPLNLVDAGPTQAYRRRPQQRLQHRVNTLSEMRQARARQAEKCHRAEQGLRQIRAKRRIGYSAEQGRKLRLRAERYRAEQRFYCR